MEVLLQYYDVFAMFILLFIIICLNNDSLSIPLKCKYGAWF